MRFEHPDTAGAAISGDPFGGVGDGVVRVDIPSVVSILTQPLRQQRDATGALVVPGSIAARLATGAADGMRARVRQLLPALTWIALVVALAVKLAVMLEVQGSRQPSESSRLWRMFSMVKTMRSFCPCVNAE